MSRVSLAGWNRSMLVFAAANVVLAVVAVVGLAVDDRVLDGVPIWIKPLKFAVSSAVYGVTWAWLAALVDYRGRTVRRVSTVVAVLLSVELAAIVGQAVRGRRSHFNVSTVLDTVVYNLMAVSIIVVWVGALVLTVMVRRSDIRDRAYQATVGWGAVLSLVGIGLGVLMTIPTGAQFAALNLGQGHVLGAHTVGAPDGGPGLPLLGWSTVGGDLRIPHFVGMHGLQALLVWNLVLGLFAGRMSVAARAALVRVGAAGYGGLLAILVWQAYRGQPLVSPDAWTLTAAGVLVAAMVVAAIRALRRDRSRVDTPPPVPDLEPTRREPAGTAAR